MSEMREEFRDRIARVAAEEDRFDPDEYMDWKQTPHFNPYADMAEAVYAEALRDVANLLDTDTGETHVSFPRLVIEQFASKHGIDL